MNTKAQEHIDYLRAISSSLKNPNVNHIAEFIEKQELIIEALKKQLTKADAIGYVYTYMCLEADKGVDVRTIELPKIYEAFQRDREPPLMHNAFVEKGCEQFA